MFLSTSVMCFLETAKAMTAEGALRWCSSTYNWIEFSQRVTEYYCARRVNLSILSRCKLQNLDEAGDLT